MIARPREVTVRGVGLHTGAESRVTIRAQPGPVRLRRAGVEAAVADLVVASTDRSTTVAAKSGFRVATVEHLFAALAGLAVLDGAVIDVDGPELPLLDGGSSAWCDAIASLGLGEFPRAPSLSVARTGAVSIASSRYEFDVGTGV